MTPSAINAFVTQKIEKKILKKLQITLFFLFSFVFSNTYYRVELYGNARKSNSNPLQVGQNRILHAFQYKNKYFPNLENSRYDH